MSEGGLAQLQEQSNVACDRIQAGPADHRATTPPALDLDKLLGLENA
jgi:hypothetical protein